MCFSAGASFGSGAVLSLIGVAAIRKVSNPSQLPLATFPFLFSFQQFCEGFVWLSLIDSSYSAWQHPGTYGFLSFSHIIWPVWIPLSTVLLEKDFSRKRLLCALLGVATILALYHLYCLLYLTVTAKIDGHHIQYLISHPTKLLIAADILYVLSTIIPFFISSIKRMRWLGVYVIVSYLVAYILFKAYVISVWCYFATILSVFTLIILCSIHKSAISGDRIPMRLHDSLD